MTSSSIFHPLIRLPIFTHQITTTPYQSHTTKMSCTMTARPRCRSPQYQQVYRVASTARSKLQYEAEKSDHSLRLLVGHANLLDTFMGALSEDTERLRKDHQRHSKHLEQLSESDSDDNEDIDSDSDGEELHLVRSPPRPAKASPPPKPTREISRDNVSRRQRPRRDSVLDSVDEEPSNDHHSHRSSGADRRRSEDHSKKSSSTQPIRPPVTHSSRGGYRPSNNMQPHKIAVSAAA